jgi:hypothetical protein
MPPRKLLLNSPRQLVRLQGLFASVMRRWLNVPKNGQKGKLQNVKNQALKIMAKRRMCQLLPLPPMLVDLPHYVIRLRCPMLAQAIVSRLEKVRSLENRGLAWVVAQGLKRTGCVTAGISETYVIQERENVIATGTGGENATWKQSDI